MKKVKKINIVFLLGILFFSCSENENTEQNPIKQDIEIDTLQMIDFPSSAESSVSNLYVGKNGVTYLTWIEKEDTISTLYFSTLNNNEWSKPTKISEGNDWIVNWADFSTLTQFGDNSLVINVLKETDKESFAYDVQLLISNDNGISWGEAFSPHLDGTKTEHGFVSLVPYKEESFMAIWLDGRKYASKNTPQEMTLRAAVINKEGDIKEEFLIDERVCDCCGTNAVVTDEGIAVVYRDRSENEIRDISIVHFKDGEWSKTQSISNDNWEIFGCPVNGPSIDSYEGELAISWFTGANDIPKVNTIFSDGISFTDSVTQISVGNTNGRVDVCYIDEENAIVSWMESENDQFFIKARGIKTNGSELMTAPIVISKIEGGRASGFPKMVKNGENVIFTWTETGEKSTIKTARINTSIFK